MEIETLLIKNNEYRSVLFVLSSFISSIHSAHTRSCNSEGMYTVSYNNGSWKCQPCTVCLPGARISQPCRYNSDTVCEQCPQETFVSSNGSDCIQCTQCPPGYYVQRQCRGTVDRFCGKCATSYFAKKTNSFQCMRCSSCRPGETILRRCNGRHDTTCGGCDQNYYRESSSLKCVPCSPCQDSRSVRVSECVRKLGKESDKVCQLQKFVLKVIAPTEATFEDISTQTFHSTADSLIVTLTVVVLVSVIGCTMSCLAFLRYCLRYKTVASRVNLKENASFDCASVTLLENPESQTLSDSVSKSRNDNVANNRAEETVEMVELHLRTLLEEENENETEITITANEMNKS